jgi:putative ABC transport system permease protein
VAAEVRRLVASLNPNVPVAEARTLQSVVSASTARSRSMMWVFVSFGCLALLLAVIGTYGTVSYSTAQRTYEMGVRVALGATRTSIFFMVLRQSLTLAAVGLALGVPASLALNRMLTRFLYGVSSTDAATLAAVSLLMVVVALAGGYFPARRAANVNPVLTLRAD